MYVVMKEYDICILGAGISGLYCARELSKRYPKSTLCILEKYEYIGGRISTFRHMVPGVGQISWEAGAGRIHSSHHMVIDLLNEYNIKTVPIKANIDYRTNTTVEPIEFNRYLTNLSSITDLPKATLSSLTLKNVFEKTLGKSRATDLLDHYEYRSELDTLRADKGLDILSSILGQQDDFYTVKGGFSSLIGALKRKIGGILLREHEATDITRTKDSKYTITIKGKDSIRASTVIVALPRDAVAKIPCFKGLHILKQVKMRPLLRIYAVFPIVDTVWFNDIDKFICASPIRYVIPLNKAKGTMMISYTDGDDALRWIERIQQVGESVVINESIGELRGLFPERVIPDPIYFKCHSWLDGCSYWLPSKIDYSIETESKASILPFPDSMPGVYMCGESWAENQCWVESALNQTKKMLQVFHASAAVAKAST